MKNTSGKHLLQGPLTVMDGGYAGDARIDDLPPGQDRLLSYGVDLETLATTKWLSSSRRRDDRQDRQGHALDRRAHVESTKSYALENKSGEGQDDHHRAPGPRGLDAGRHAQAARDDARASTASRANAPAHKVATLTVKEESVRTESLAMLPMDVTQLLFYQRTGSIPSNVRDAIAKAIALKNA